MEGFVDTLQGEEPEKFRFSCETQSDKHLLNLSLITERASQGKILHLFCRDSKLRWQISSTSLKDSTAQKLKAEFQNAINFMQLQHLFENVSGKKQKPHIRIKGTRTDGYYACSFFPPENGDLSVTRHLVELGTLSMRRVFEHEIGHIIGFRHEFEDTYFLPITSPYPLSFMSYNMTGLTQTDTEIIDLMYGSDPDGAKEMKFKSMLNSDVKFSRVQPKYSNSKF